MLVFSCTVHEKTTTKVVTSGDLVVTETTITTVETKKIENSKTKKVKRFKKAKKPWWEKQKRKPKYEESHEERLDPDLFKKKKF